MSSERERGCPEWGVGPDGRAVNIVGDERLHALFQDWLGDACDHDRKITIRRMDASDRPFFSVYCEDCGHQVRSHLGFNQVREISDVTYDEIMRRRDIYASARQRGYEKIANDAAERMQGDNRRAYDDYLRSDTWKRRAAKIIQHAGGICQGCLTNPAKEVHHLTYEHIGAEFAWELRAVCESCHRRLHKRPA